MSSPTTPQPDVPVQQKSWFGRNWKWLVPVGCLVPMLCCLSFAAVTYLGVSKVIAGSPAFVTALDRASQNAEVKAALGEPLTPGFGIQGSSEEHGGGHATADFTAPIEGPKGKGTLRVVGEGVSGKWTYQRMELEVNGKVIDLLEREAPPLPPDVHPDDAAGSGATQPEPADPSEDEPEGE